MSDEKIAYYFYSYRGATAFGNGVVKVTTRGVAEPEFNIAGAQKELRKKYEPSCCIVFFQEISELQADQMKQANQ